MQVDVSKNAEMDVVYSQQFFQKQVQTSHAARKNFVDLVIKYFAPTSLVDVGCGTGQWVAGFQAYGVRDCLGIDGAWARAAGLLISDDCFLEMNLQAPTNLNRKFDVALSLEVAEHLAPACAERFIHFLTSLAPIVIFSAAAPGQGGTHHINERWPDFWSNLFRASRYSCIDMLRPELWAIKDLQPWYKQNTLVFAHGETLAAELEAKARARFPLMPDGSPLSLVHPDIFGMALQFDSRSIGDIVRGLGRQSVRRAARRLRMTRPH